MKEFNEESKSWLKEKDFSDEEIQRLEKRLNLVFKHQENSDERFIVLPKNTHRKVAAMIYLLDSITDADGKPLCIEDDELVIPEEAKEEYDHALELEEVEDAIGVIQDVKFGRDHSTPKHSSSVKDERYEREI